MIVKVEYDSEFQLNVLSALVQSFENEGINFDKFLIWLLKNNHPGTSIILNQLAKKSDE